MLTTARNTLTAILLSSVAIVPAATVSFVATADAAYAKSEKSQGGGKSAGKSGKSGKAYGKGPKSNNGKSGGQSSRGKPSKTLSDLGDDIRGLFGKGKKKSKTVAKGKKASSSVVAEAETPEETEDLFVRGKSGKSSKFHPSELGNMNGAMNANMNAVLAHIRNGNTNGPVGHLAALAINADAADSAEDLENIQQSYAELRAALGVEDGADPTEAVEAYLARESEIVEDTELAGWIEAYEDDESDTGGDEDLLNQINERLNEYEAGDYDTYKAQKSFVDQSLTDLEYMSDDGFGVGEPSEDDVDAANAKAEAEDAILAYWNKNPGDSEVEDGEATPQDHLLDELYARFEGYEDEIDEAIAEGEARAGESTETEGEDEIVDDCGADEDCEPEEELALVE